MGFGVLLDRFASRRRVFWVLFSIALPLGAASFGCYSRSLCLSALRLLGVLLDRFASRRCVFVGFILFAAPLGAVSLCPRGPIGGLAGRRLCGVLPGARSCPRNLQHATPATIRRPTEGGSVAGTRTPALTGRIGRQASGASPVSISSIMRLRAVRPFLFTTVA